MEVIEEEEQVVDYSMDTKKDANMEDSLTKEKESSTSPKKLSYKDTVLVNELSEKLNPEEIV